MRMYGRREKLTAEQTEANRVAKLAREAATMTCQCCGRKHLANRGWIAHHGYQRPGYGYQTASCFGAKALPFEVARSKLGQWIAMLKDMKARMIVALDNVKLEQVGVKLHYSFVDYRGPNRYATNRTERNVTFTVTRATWDSVVAAEDNAEIFRMRGWTSFDDQKIVEVANRESKIAHITRDIEEQTKRYNGWKQTHEWSQYKQAWIEYGIEGAI